MWRLLRGTNSPGERMGIAKTRRSFLVSTTAVGTGLLIGCRRDEADGDPAKRTPSTSESARKDDRSSEKARENEVTATEDLMRDHGVIRRALVVYREAAVRLRAKSAEVPADALQKTAKLLRKFAGDYHEKKLEETHIFPALKRAGGPAAAYVDVLVAQHDRAREINDYLIAGAGAKLTAANTEAVARALEAFARMYEEHAAIEDTVLFPAWKKSMSAKQFDDTSELFEDIEHKTLGKSGFEDAVDEIAAIERAFRLDLGGFTAPPPGAP
jgi:hemerythrin-like domain-containing protein